MTMNKVDYFEIGTTNPEETERFYSDLFGWQIGLRASLTPTATALACGGRRADHE